MGHEGDTVNNLCSLLWAYGGRIADEKGVPDITNSANKAAIDVAVRMFQAKLIPPDTFASTVTSWNNEAYQKGRCGPAGARQAGREVCGWTDPWLP